MATTPESIEDREQPIYRKVIDVAENIITQKTSRERWLYALAAAFGSLAPAPFGAFAAACIALAAFERR